MRANRLILLSLLAAAVLGACTEKEVKPTADIGRIEQIDLFISSLRGFATARDLEKLDRVYPEDRRGDIPEIEKAVGRLKDPALDLVIDRIFLDKDRAEVTLHWEYRWEGTSDAASDVRRGNAVLTLEGSQDLRMAEISGDNPFTAPLAVKASEK
jgi:hypothetical protein